MNHIPDGLDSRRTHLGTAQRTTRLAITTGIAALVLAQVWLLVLLTAR